MQRRKASNPDCLLIKTMAVGDCLVAKHLGATTHQNYRVLRVHAIRGNDAAAQPLKPSSVCYTREGTARLLTTAASKPLKNRWVAVTVPECQPATLGESSSFIAARMHLPPAEAQQGSHWPQQPALYLNPL